jgi:hypothetical protein
MALQATKLGFAFWGLLSCISHQVCSQKRCFLLLIPVSAGVQDVRRLYCQHHYSLFPLPDVSSCPIGLFHEPLVSSLGMQRGRVRSACVRCRRQKLKVSQLCLKIPLRLDLSGIVVRPQSAVPIMCSVWSAMRIIDGSVPVSNSYPVFSCLYC